MPGPWDRRPADVDAIAHEMVAEIGKRRSIVWALFRLAKVRGWQQMRQGLRLFFAVARAGPFNRG